MTRRGVYRHAGPRRHNSWWRGPWPPTILLAVLLPIVGFELWLLIGVLQSAGGG